MDIYEQYEELTKQINELVTGYHTKVELKLTPIQDVTEILTNLGFSDQYKFHFKSYSFTIDFECLYEHPYYGRYVYQGSLEDGKCLIIKKI